MWDFFIFKQFEIFFDENLYKKVINFEYTYFKDSTVANHQKQTIYNLKALISLCFIRYDRMYIPSKAHRTCKNDQIHFHILVDQQFLHKSFVQSQAGICENKFLKGPQMVDSLQT